MESTPALPMDAEMNSEEMKTQNARRESILTKPSDLQRCVKHLWHPSIDNKSSVFFSSTFNFFTQFFFSDREITENCSLPLDQEKEPYSTSMLPGGEYWMLSQWVPLLGQRLLEGEPGPPKTLVQARVTEAGKQVFYELGRQKGRQETKKK